LFTIILDSNDKPYRRTVVFDVETTGLYPEADDRIIEIGAMALVGDTILDEFHSLIDLDRPISTEAQRIHGITQEMLAGQPRAEEVLPQFRSFIEDSIMVAHSAEFDLSFVGSEFRRLKLDFSQPYYCTLALGRKVFPGLERHDLGSLYKHLYGELPLITHRALDDAWIAAMIWMKLNQLMSLLIYNYGPH